MSLLQLLLPEISNLKKENLERYLCVIEATSYLEILDRRNLTAYSDKTRNLIEPRIQNRGIGDSARI